MGGFIKLKTVKNMLCTDVTLCLHLDHNELVPVIVFDGSSFNIPADLLDYKVLQIKPRIPQPKDGISEGLYIYLAE